MAFNYYNYYFRTYIGGRPYTFEMCKDGYLFFVYN